MGNLGRLVGAKRPVFTTADIFGILGDMKQGIHPTYHPEAKVVCACGNTFTVGSTREEIHVEVCSNCHPFYTGEAKFVDTEGRVERFQRREKAKVEPKAKKEAEKKEPERPQTLKDMLQQLQKSS